MEMSRQLKHNRDITSNFQVEPLSLEVTNKPKRYNTLQTNESTESPLQKDTKVHPETIITQSMPKMQYQNLPGGNYSPESSVKS